MMLKNPKESLWLFSIDDNYVAYCYPNAPLPKYQAALAYTDYLTCSTVRSTFTEVKL